MRQIVLALVALGLGALAALLAAGVPPAGAQTRPYCLQGRQTSGMLDCTYHSWEQCRASIIGGGDSCMENPALLWEQRERARARPPAKRQTREPR